MDLRSSWGLEPKRGDNREIEMDNLDCDEKHGLVVLRDAKGATHIRERHAWSGH